MWSLLYTRQIKVLLMKPSSATTLKTRCFYYQIWKTKKVFPHSHSNWKCTEFARLVQQCDQVSPAWSSRTSCPSWKCHCKLIIQKHICGNKKKNRQNHTHTYMYMHTEYKALERDYRPFQSSRPTQSDEYWSLVAIWGPWNIALVHWSMSLYLWSRPDASIHQI